MDTTTISTDLPSPTWTARRWRPRTAGTLALIAGAPLAAILVALIAALLADDTPDLFWHYVPILIMLSALHYVFAAWSLLGIAGRPLPLRETFLTQLTAAAANRLTPGGFGAAAVNARFLVCRGVAAPRAISAVGVLHVLGALADVLLFLLFVALGGDVLVGALGDRLWSMAHLPHLPLVLAGLGVLAGVWLALRRRTPGGARVIAQTAAETGAYLRRPRELLVATAASAAGTVVLGLAFALSVFTVPGAARPGQTIALITAYIISAAAGSALPLPGAIGPTEAAMIATLATIGVGTGSAVTAVVLFRVITYWAPVPFGLITTKHLRTKQAENCPD